MSWVKQNTNVSGEYPNDQAGHSISLSSDGTFVAVGIPSSDINGIDSGQVRVFEKINNSLAQVGSEINGKDAGDQFGNSISISADGSKIAIGGYLNDDNGENSGHVRIYENHQGSWKKVGEDIKGKKEADNSGYSVSLSADGSVVAIGSPKSDQNGSDSGLVQIYKDINNVWTQIGDDIEGNDSNIESGAAVSLSVDGSVVAIGSPKSDQNGKDSGLIRIYENINNSWLQKGNDIDGEFAEDQFGTSIDLSEDGTIVAIGAPFNDGIGLDTGHVRIYQFITDDWKQIGSDINGEMTGDKFGTSVSLTPDGSVVAIGAPFNDGSALDSGHSRVYQHISGSWEQIGLDINGNLTNDQLGSSIDISEDGSLLVIGAAFFDGEDEENIGEVTFFTKDISPPLITGFSGNEGDLTTSISVVENNTLVHTFTANEIVEWSIQNTGDNELFTIDNATGELIFKERPDHENPIDDNKGNDYVLAVEATDQGNNSSSQIVIITITDDVQAPQIIGPSESEGEFDLSSSVLIEENNSIIYDFDSNETVNWSIEEGKDSKLFDIDKNDGVLRFLESPNYEIPLDTDGNNTYLVTISASDLEQNKAYNEVTVYVSDIIEPTYSFSSHQSSIYREEANITTRVSTEFVNAGSTIYWNLSGIGIDQNDFSLGLISGSSIVDENGDFEFEHITKDDELPEGKETIQIRLFSDISHSNQLGEVFQINLMDPAITQKIYNPSSGEVVAHEIGKEYLLGHIRDYDGNLHAGSSNVEVASSYKFQKILDVNGDTILDAIYTNSKNGRWVTASIDPITGEIDFSDHGAGGGTRVVGIYADPLIAEGADNGGFLSDGVTPAPANFGVLDEERYVEVNGERVDRLALNSQVRFQNDLEIDNLQAKHSGDYDDDGVNEVYWKTADGTAYLRALMHDDGNIRYANYQSEQQMTDYLTTQGHESVVGEIV